MQGPLWDKASRDVKELIQRLMAFDPGARLTVDKVSFALQMQFLHRFAAK